MARRGDIIKIIKVNDYDISVGESLIVISGADIDGQIVVDRYDGGTAVLDWDEYETEESKR